VSITEARAVVAECAAKLKKASDDANEARSVLEKAEHDFDVDPAKGRRQLVLESKATLERADRLQVRAAEALESARAQLLQAEHAERAAKFAELRRELDSLAETRERHVAALVALDEQADREIVAIAKTVAAGSQIYKSLEELARDLGPEGRTTFDTVVVASLADTRLRTQRAVTMARQKAGRDPLAPAWLAAADLSMLGFDASGLAAVQALAARNREQELRAEGATVAAVRSLAALNAPPAPPAAPPTPPTNGATT
jgi:hypothetical protein